MKFLSGIFPILVEITRDSELWQYVIIAAVFGIIAGIAFRKKAGQIAFLVFCGLYLLAEVCMHLPVGLKIQLVMEFLGIFGLGCCLGMLLPVIVKGLKGKNDKD